MHWETVQGTCRSERNANQQRIMGHYADKELAYAYLDTYDYSKALRHALVEYKRRPENIDVNQALAWVYYKLGKYEEADKYVSVALKTNSKNPVLLYEAGLIKKSSGKMEEGLRMISEAKSINPFISPVLKWEGNKLLSTQK
jgi:tetratricopeptide (TPR) repeat protein